jgi:hypothetical protein
MPNSIYVLPDAKLAVIEYLSSITAVTTLVPATNILTKVPLTGVTYPYILVQWGGGNGIWPALDEPAIQIDVVGDTEFNCGKIARTVRAVIWAIANDTVAAGVLVSGADEMSPTWMPDNVANPPLSRFTARYRIILHP